MKLTDIGIEIQNFVNFYKICVEDIFWKFNRKIRELVLNTCEGHFLEFNITTI